MIEVNWSAIPEYISVFDTLRSANNGLNHPYYFMNKENEAHFPFLKFDNALIQKSKIPTFITHFLNTTESALYKIDETYYLMLNEESMNKCAYYFNYQLSVKTFYFISERDHVKKVNLEKETNLFELTDFGNVPLARFTFNDSETVITGIEFVEIEEQEKDEVIDYFKILSQEVQENYHEISQGNLLKIDEDEVKEKENAEEENSYDNSIVDFEKMNQPQVISVEDETDHDDSEDESQDGTNSFDDDDFY